MEHLAEQNKVSKEHVPGFGEIVGSFHSHGAELTGRLIDEIHQREVRDYSHEYNECRGIGIDVKHSQDMALLMSGINSFHDQ